MPDTIVVSDVIPADPETIFDAWLDGAAHSKMTGGQAECSPAVGSEFSAWHGYIAGTQVANERPGRIVQNWRTSDFPDDADDSQIEILLEAVDGGTRITIHHTNIPDGQGPDYDKGWDQFYFAPMKKFYA